MKNHEQFVAEEYAKAGKPLDYVVIGDKSFILPLSYDGDAEKFIEDLFSFQDNRYHEYEDYNHNSDQQIEPLSIKITDVCKICITGYEPLKSFFKHNMVKKLRNNAKLQEKLNDLYVIPKLNQTIDNTPKNKIIKAALQTSNRKYNAAIKKIVRAREEYPNQTFAITVDQKQLDDLDDLHSKYVKQKIINGLKKTFKFAAAQTAEIVGGAAGALPAAVYYLIDKKVRVAKRNNQDKGKIKSFVDDQMLPRIRRGSLKALSLLSLFAATKIVPCVNKVTETINERKEAKAQALRQKLNQQSFQQKFTITDKESFAQLYEQAFPLMTLAMMPTEILICDAYSDNGKTINTAGLGSYWMPKDGNPSSSEWIKTSAYVKDKPDFSITGEQACNLADGWFRSREGGRVYNKMFNLLQGAELNICEFAAIANCVYNDEQNGFKLCSFVKDNYQDPIKCADYLMKLKPRNSAFNNGILKRHTHEALLYLNIDDYARKIPYFMVKEGVNSNGDTYHVSAVTQLSVADCDTLAMVLQSNEMTGASKLVGKIYNYLPKGGEAIYEIAGKHGLSNLLDCYDNTLDFEGVQHNLDAKKLYDDALKLYEAKNYDQALKAFENMIAQGYDGADIYNDIAITKYHLGDYLGCIEACQHVLSTGETELYSAANFNAGKAYEELGNDEKAKQNYRLAQQRDQNNSTYAKALQKLNNKPNPALLTQNTR